MRYKAHFYAYFNFKLQTHEKKLNGRFMRFFGHSSAAVFNQILGIVLILICTEDVWRSL